MYRWMMALERKGMKININKTEYLCVSKQEEGIPSLKRQGKSTGRMNRWRKII